MKKFTVLCLTFIMAFAALGSISANATTSLKPPIIKIVQAPYFGLLQLKVPLLITVVLQNAQAVLIAQPHRHLLGL